MRMSQTIQKYVEKAELVVLVVSGILLVNVTTPTFIYSPKIERHAC